VYLTPEAIDVNDLLQEVLSSEGALCLFLGIVRDENAGRGTVEILYEAYGPMAEEELARIAAEISREWPESRLRVRHRIGTVRVGEASVAIAATAPHRADAFAACRAAIDRIKTRVPIWKKEFHPDGTSDWVDPTALVRFAVSDQEDS
jgi:molybdopterin synthase catalytic subunit